MTKVRVHIDGYKTYEVDDKDEYDAVASAEELARKDFEEELDEFYPEGEVETDEDVIDEEEEEPTDDDDIIDDDID